MNNIGTKKQDTGCAGCSYQAFLILRIVFTIIPIVAGLDKFFNFLVNWEIYLSPLFNVFSNDITTMKVVGVIEIIAGLGVWFKPKIFAYIVMAWLLSIIINLLLLHEFYDIAARDLGLALSALAFARLSSKFD